jgi:hypothetical protein
MDTCGHSPYIISSLTRGLVCHLQLLLALASASILGSESCRTRDHILQSQIRDFLFCRLLRLTRLRWRYSTPPPYGNNSQLAGDRRYIASVWTQHKTPFPNNPFIVACVFVNVGKCFPSLCLAMNVYCDSTIPSCHKVWRGHQSWFQAVFARHIVIVALIIIIITTTIIIITKTQNQKHQQ